ncbi:WD40/YVTN/BNR-like repeat-containing protein [Roseiflexus sp.]|uniref:WD40/YVTN/BNR-like repeat-containing protein n=1 Tax=Roseiflexus sp. TaxID=2562120 RepID=UPI00398B2CC2
MANAILLFLATDDGLALLSDPAGQRRWRRSMHQFQRSIVQSVWVDASKPLVVLVIADRLLYRSVDGGQTWATLNAGDLLTPNARLYAAPRHPSLVYLLSGDVLFTSDDAGAAWRRTSLANESGGFAIDDDARLYRSCGAQILTSDDRGETWHVYSPPLPGTIRILNAMPGQPGTLCALADGCVYVVERASWRPIGDLPGKALACTALTGTPPTLLAALTEGGIIRGTPDAWEPVIVECPWTGATTILKPARHHIDTSFAVSTTGDVAISMDRGRSWTMVCQGLATVRDLVSARLV